ncbi:ferritin-like domain-containing protein [Pseudanabaena sp. FACHB-1998]|uniref:ferritin-like domain-containing protein n=1 Tax=Pseudanabaena sp. FACHB-1998 TaxID=2692858 RepID=UPI001681688D|nr:ferritin-like domain-containing protein [Pseudanabaena sp. FACHB-1998]MBD2178632.1 ferritin-like domain-containing protein [Pseudanabaena sp. FACHB-1998]
MKLKIIFDNFKNVADTALFSLKICFAFIPFLCGFLFFSPIPSAYAQSSVLSPRQVAEYALTLEKLEADFYQRAAMAAMNGGLASAPQIAKDAIASYGEDEANHVTDLSAALRSIGGDPEAIKIPTNPNYSAILGRDPFANPRDFLLAGQYVEDLGVAAYKGQVQNLLAAGDAGKPVLAAALAIHSVEARHAAGIRFLRETLLGESVRPWISTNASNREVIYNENRQGSPIPFNQDAFDGYATKDEVLALVTPILNLTSSFPVQPMEETAPANTNEPSAPTTTNEPSAPANTNEPSAPTTTNEPSAPVRALW